LAESHKIFIATRMEVLPNSATTTQIPNLICSLHPIGSELYELMIPTLLNDVWLWKNEEGSGRGLY